MARGIDHPSDHDLGQVTFHIRRNRSLKAYSQHVLCIRGSHRDFQRLRANLRGIAGRRLTGLARNAKCSWRNYERRHAKASLGGRLV